MPNPLPFDGSSTLGPTAGATAGPTAKLGLAERWLRQPAPLRFFSVYLLSLAALLIALWPVLHDAHYWDAGGCYVYEARLHLLHGADVEAIRAHLHQYLLRPVFYTGLLSLVLRFIGDSPFIVHTFHLMFCCMLPAALSQITLALGGRVWQAWLSAFLCLTTPIFIAQIGLVQTDLPLTALLAMAWWSLLVNQRLLFCLFAALSVWTKETGYFLAVPAAILLWWQAATTPDPQRVARSSVRRLLGVALSAWPALTPPLALSLWLLIRRIIKGNWMESDHVHALSLVSPAAHYHNWLDAGRFAASILMLIALYHYWHKPEGRERRVVLCTGLAFLLLPWLFPSYLPRYMLPSLVFSVPLAAIGLGCIPAIWQKRIFVLVSAIHLFAQTGRLTMKDIAHLESSLAYRRLLHLHQQAATALAAERPRQVLAGFPAGFFLTAAPMMGYLPQTLPVRGVSPTDRLADWCQADWLIEAQDDTVQPAVRGLKAHGALTLVQQLGPPPRRPGEPVLDKERDETVRLYRIHCPPQTQ